jgi:tripartite-type tricarboxylate transporter receptor subunit TctC
MHPVLGTALAGLALGLGITASALAQQYPFKPVRIIVPFPAAGAVDATTLSIGLYKDLPYDPAKFVPITITATLPNAIAARIDLPGTRPDTVVVA